MSRGREATTRAASRAGYRADIQGLRALAILSVVIYHANEDLLGGGFVGVDVFFVISGYLITGILRAEIEQNRNSIVAFYGRRIRRLFPSLFLMLATASVFAWFLLEPDELREFGGTLFSTVFFVSNFDFLAHSGYFAGDAQLKPLLHTWSLAVEEQFYIVFPLLLALLWRGRRAVTLAALVLLFVVSLGLSAWLTQTNLAAAFYLAPSRGFELLVGAILALGAAPQIRTQTMRDGLSIAGLVLILLSFAVINDSAPFPGLLALLPCTGAALMLHAGDGGVSRAGRWISVAPFQFFGALSYSLYLWHWPLLVFARHYTMHELSSWLAFGVVSVATAIAYLSWRFVEQPILTRKLPPIRVLVAGAVTMAAGAAVGLALYTQQGFPSRFSREALDLFAGEQDFNPQRACEQGDETVLPYDRNCVFGARTAPSTAVWGDSFAGELPVAIGDRLRPLGQAVMEISATRCPPAPGFDAQQVAPCAAHNTETLRRLVADPRIRHVILISNLAGHAHRPSERDALEAGYRRAVAALLASGKHVTLIAQVPVMPSEPPAALGMMANAHRSLLTYGTPRVEHERRSAWANGFVRSLQGATIVDPAAILCDQALCHAVRPGAARSLYWDHGHLSLTGARVLAAQIPLQ